MSVPGLHYLIHGAHLAASGRARVAIDRRFHDVYAYEVPSIRHEVERARSPLIGIRPEWFATELTIVSEAPLQRHVTSREEARQLAAMQFMRVVRDDAPDLTVPWPERAEIDAARWAEAMWMLSTLFFERLGGLIR